MATTTGPYWVTWQDTGNAAQAKASASILGGTIAPPHPAGYFQAGPFSTYAAAQAFEAQIGTNAILPAPGTPTIGSTNLNPAQYLSPLGDIGNFFHIIGEKSTWIRLGEAALGGILLYVGVRALAQGSTTVGAQARKPVTRTVKKVGKTAAGIAVPEARLATRTVAKRVAPKATQRVAAHRQRVRTYGGKTPYQPPKPRQPIVHKVERTSTIIHKKA